MNKHLEPKSNFELVKEFHDKFSIPTAALDNMEVKNLRYDLIHEELKEVENELFTGFFNRKIMQMEYPPSIKSKLAKELTDLLYVVYGTAVTFDIDIDTVFAAVHASNMSKLGEDGKPVYRKDGKVTKGPNYQPPDLSWLDE